MAYFLINFLFPSWDTFSLGFCDNTSMFSSVSPLPPFLVSLLASHPQLKLYVGCLGIVLGTSLYILTPSISSSYPMALHPFYMPTAHGFMSPEPIALLSGLS